MVFSLSACTHSKIEKEKLRKQRVAERERGRESLGKIWKKEGENQIPKTPLKNTTYSQN